MLPDYWWTMLEARFTEQDNNTCAMIMMIMILIVSIRNMKLIFKFNRTLFTMNDHPTPILQNNIHDEPPKPKPLNKMNVYAISTTYFIHNAKHQPTPGALVDRGANGGVAGNDTRILHKHPSRRVEIQGIDNHRVPPVPIVTAASVTNTQ